MASSWLAVAIVAAIATAIGVLVPLACARRQPEPPPHDPHRLFLQDKRPDGIKALDRLLDTPSQITVAEWTDDHGYLHGQLHNDSHELLTLLGLEITSVKWKRTYTVALPYVGLNKTADFKVYLGEPDLKVLEFEAISAFQTKARFQAN
jgi:hypothetical protein